MKDRLPELRNFELWEFILYIFKESFQSLSRVSVSIRTSYDENFRQSLLFQGRAIFLGP